MNLRCIYCQTPFTLGRAEMLNAIITMNERHQNHYDAHCPRCRRANSISRQRMELFFPNWQAAARELASAPPPVETPAPAAPKVETPATAFLKTEPLPRVAKEIGTGTPAPAEKKAAEKKPTEKAAPKAKKASADKPSAAKPPAREKKPAAIKKTPVAKKTTTSTATKAKKPAAKTTETKPKKK